MISSNFTTKNSDVFFRFNEQCACIIFGQEVLQPFWPGPVLHCWPLFDHDSLECGNAARWSIRMWPLSRQEQIIYRTVMTTKIPPKGRIFSEKDWYYLEAQTDMPFHYLKLVV